jgi:SNF2 family DNA or RNA helicase
MLSSFHSRLEVQVSPLTGLLLSHLTSYLSGLNLTCCNHVILVDLWWNPALEEQAFDRAHRLGQKRDVKIVKLTIENTVEERILELQEKKREIARAALSGDKIKGNKLSMDELMNLFSRKHDDAATDEED